jgi:hypothetical protein
LTQSAVLSSRDPTPELRPSTLERLSAPAQPLASPTCTIQQTAHLRKHRAKMGLNVGIDAATFVFKEFWPNINHALFHAKN